MSGSEPNAHTSRAARLDAVAVALVLAVAGVAASFVARNSDLWLHLATGRLIAQGEYRFGTDPFAAAEPYWANHAWLWDLGAFLAFGALGGAALVALKALAVVLTAALMFAACRPRGAPLWLCSTSVLLGVLAMTPRLLLQPAVASYLLLAALLASLSTGRALRAVPVLIAVWANLDSWFVLGPALVLLFALDGARRATWPRWFLPASLLAWLANPHHVFALQLPMEMSAWGGELANDPRFAALFASPWRWALFENFSPAAWAHALLLALGALSFAANRAAVRSWRAPVWVAFAALGAWQARLVPFFAVVGAPILASNLCEVWPAAARERAGRSLAVLASAALLALAWFGGLTGVQARDRGAAWAVHSEPGLERAALNLKEWRAAHPNERALVTHPDLAHYLAWHAPEVRGFVDSRFQLFAGRAPEYVAHCRGLGLIPGDSAFTLRAPDVVALYDPDGGRMANALATPGWELHRAAGSAALLTLPDRRAGFDAARAAFGGATDLPVAGEAEPAVEAEASAWRRETGRAGSWPADAAGVYLRAGTGDSGALALLAVRAARAGTEADPRDALAWLTLGRAYLILGAREGADGGALAPLGQLRGAQATGALARAAALNPDLIAAHDALAQLYSGRHALDSAQAHAREVARLVKRNGRGPAEAVADFAQRVARAERAADALEATVFEAENRLLIRTGGRAGDPLGKARAAVELGLAQKALDILLAAPPDLYGTDGLRLLADLLLRTGRVAECRALLDRAELARNPDALGFYEVPRRGRAPYRFAAYDWFDACQRAAAGHYKAATAALERLIERAKGDARTVRPALERGGAALFAGEVAAAVPPRPALARLALAPELLALSDYLGRAIELGAVAGDLHAVAGALELERGNLAGAGARFRAALELYAPVRAAGLPVPGAALAARYDGALRR